MVNERFPHIIKVERLTHNENYNPSFGGDEFSSETIYESVCQNQIGSGGDTSFRTDALLSDYITYCPFPDFAIDVYLATESRDIVTTEDGEYILLYKEIRERPYYSFVGDRKAMPLIKKGDLITLNDGLRIIKGFVIQFEAGNLGNRIWWNEG